MSYTEDDLVTRVRGVIADLDYRETTGFDFTKAPAGALDKSFWLSYEAEAPIGGMNFTEDARGALTVRVARSTDADYQAARRTLLADARTILRAVVRDGATTTGEYNVEDTRRVLNIEAPRGAGYLVLTLAMPVSYEATL